MNNFTHTYKNSLGEDVKCYISEAKITVSYEYPLGNFKPNINHPLSVNNRPRKNVKVDDSKYWVINEYKARVLLKLDDLSPIEESEDLEISMNMTSKVLYPTDKVQKVESIFLAGTIDMGNSEDWQQKIIDELSNTPVTIFNPRRLDWDSSWKQVPEDKNFNHQVTWELNCLQKADLIVMYLAPNSKSPITLLELGLFGTYKDKLIVCCPDGFYRRGNIQITSREYNIPFYDDMDTFVSAIKERIKEKI